MHGSLCTIAQQEFDQFPSYKAPFCSGISQPRFMTYETTWLSSGTRFAVADDRRPNQNKGWNPGKKHQPTGVLKTAKTVQYFLIVGILRI